MFKIHRTGNHLDITFGGKLDRDTMREVLDEFAAQAETIEDGTGTMLYRIDDFHTPTPGAMALEISRMPKMLHLMKRFRRAAILADKNWLRNVSEWEGHLFPNLEVKAFPLSAETDAETWLTRI